MKMHTTLAALVAAGALTVAGCGDDDPGDSAAGNGTDRAFVAEMIPHHLDAIEMAKIAQERGQGPFVKELAEDIIRTQGEEVAELRAEDEELADAGVKKGTLGGGHGAMGMGEDTAALERADPFDRAFLEMMLPHHSSAVAMAKTELAEGEDPELRALAQEIIDAQEREIRAMREQL
jgi:uncharacterized protein (DUF305 family)